VITDYDPDRHFEHIDDQPQYFLDDTILEWVKNITRTHHAPQKHPANPLIVRDQPWEVWPHFNTTVCVLRDEAGRFRCWYLDFTRASFQVGAEALMAPRLSYAESTDGMRWDKPELGQVCVDGHNTNRIDWPAAIGYPIAFSIVADPIDPNPQRRYKMAYLPEGHNINIPKQSTITHSHSLGLCFAYSPDGLHWVEESANPVSLVWGSDVLTLVHDIERRRFVIYGRARYAAETGNPTGDQWFTRYYPSQPFGFVPKRSVYRIESADLLHWSEPQRVLTPGVYHNLDDQFYSLAFFRLGRYHCGLLPVFHTVENTKDSELVFSHDGMAWQHYHNAPWVVGRGDVETWDQYQIDTVVSPMRVGDQYFIYYGGADYHHDWPLVGKAQGLDTPEASYTLDQLNDGLGLAVLRVGGFVSLDAGLREGTLCTRPFFSSGERLFINARCSEGGYIDVEVLDPFEQPWSGFTRAECDQFCGDAVDHCVTWQGRAAINGIVGYTRLRFHLRHAELYSFRIADA